MINPIVFGRKALYVLNIWVVAVCLDGVPSVSADAVAALGGS